MSVLKQFQAAAPSLATCRDRLCWSAEVTPDEAKNGDCGLQCLASTFPRCYPVQTAQASSPLTVAYGRSIVREILSYESLPESLWIHLDRTTGASAAWASPEVMYGSDTGEARAKFVAQAAWDASTPRVQRRYASSPVPVEMQIPFDTVFDARGVVGDPNSGAWETFVADIGKTEADWKHLRCESVYLPAELLVLVWARLEQIFQCPKLPFPVLRIVPTSDLEEALSRKLGLPSQSDVLSALSDSSVGDRCRVVWAVFSRGFGHTVAVLLEARVEAERGVSSALHQRFLSNDYKDEWEPDYDEDDESEAPPQPLQGEDTDAEAETDPPTQPQRTSELQLSFFVTTGRTVVRRPGVYLQGT